MLENLEKKIEYTFNDRNLLLTALTHSSYANEKRNGKCNERLEFLGDAVLSIIVSDYLFKKYKSKDEGDLTKLRSSLVCEKTLKSFSEHINLGAYLRLGNGELASGGRERTSILADAFEALIAAIYLDGGYDQAKRFVMRFIFEELAHPQMSASKDYKSTLQEIIQQSGEETIEYVLTEESGPDHEKHFVVEVHLNSNVIGKGGGKSKKLAEQEAARVALQLLGY